MYCLTSSRSNYDHDADPTADATTTKNNGNNTLLRFSSQQRRHTLELDKFHEINRISSFDKSNGCGSCANIDHQCSRKKRVNSTTDSVTIEADVAGSCHNVTLSAPQTYCINHTRSIAHTLLPAPALSVTNTFTSPPIKIDRSPSSACSSLNRYSPFQIAKLTSKINSTQNLKKDRSNFKSNLFRSPIDWQQVPITNSMHQICRQYRVHRRWQLCSVIVLTSLILVDSSAVFVYTARCRQPFLCTEDEAIERPLLGSLIALGLICLTGLLFVLLHTHYVRRHFIDRLSHEIRANQELCCGTLSTFEPYHATANVRPNECTQSNVTVTTLKETLPDDRLSKHQSTLNAKPNLLELDASTLPNLIRESLLTKPANQCRYLLPEWLEADRRRLLRQKNLLPSPVPLSEFGISNPSFSLHGDSPNSLSPPIELQQLACSMPSCRCSLPKSQQLLCSGQGFKENGHCVSCSTSGSDARVDDTPYDHPSNIVPNMARYTEFAVWMLTILVSFEFSNATFVDTFFYDAETLLTNFIYSYVFLLHLLLFIHHFCTNYIAFRSAIVQRFWRRISA